MRWHMDAKAVWRRLTYRRAPTQYTFSRVLKHVRLSTDKGSFYASPMAGPFPSKTKTRCCGSVNASAASSPALFESRQHLCTVSVLTDTHSWDSGEDIENIKRTLNLYLINRELSFFFHKFAHCLCLVSMFTNKDFNEWCRLCLLVSPFQNCLSMLGWLPVRIPKELM